MYQLVNVLGMIMCLAAATSFIVQMRPCPRVQVEPPKCPTVEVKHVAATPGDCRYGLFSQMEFESRSAWLLQHLTQNNAPIIEGHSGQMATQFSIYSRIFENCSVKSITEVGFNAGHSTLVMLMSNPRARIQSFDLGQYQSARTALATLKTQFPRRELDVIWGDSRQTIPNFAKTYTGPKFDVIIVDGGHSYEVARADMINMRELGNKDSVLIVDDTMCTADYCVDKAMEDLEREGVLQIEERVPLAFDNRGLTLARYLYP
jgi:predicted O-methyltransferase YrrM